MTENTNKKRQFIRTSFISSKNTDDKKDKVIIVYKNENNQKEFTVIEEPKLSYYITKDEYWAEDKTKKNYISKEWVEQKSCVHKWRYKEIVKAINDPKLTYEYDMLMRSGRYEDVKEAQKLVDLHFRVHGSDINIEDQYINLLLNKYDPNENFVSLNKGFFDIEVDSEGLDGFPDQEKAEAPVNMITYAGTESDDTAVARSYILKYDTDTYKEFKTKQNDLMNEIDTYVKSNGIPNFKFDVLEFDNEFELIARFLKDVNNEFRPDYLMAWNLDFDFPTLYNRLIKLGQKPENFFTPDDFPYKSAYYNLDKGANDPAERKSKFFTNSYTTWMDQLALYAVINKPKGALESYTLDFIANRELGEGKADYEGEISNAHLINYERFFRYNIFDTLLCLRIERKIKHLDLLVQMVNITATRPTHVMRKTVSLRNFGMIFYEKNGFIMSNNRSKLFPKTSGQIDGGFVGDPNLVGEVGIEIMGKISQFIHKDVTDMDFAALYPSLTELYNISPETFAGKILYLDSNGVDKTVEFIDDYNSADNLNFGIKYLGLPTIEEWLNIVDEKFKVEV